MNKIAIPALLLGVVMIAGAFAFMPVQEASTVHTTIQQSSKHLVDSTITSTATNQEVKITCPSTSDGCIINEVYLISDTGDNNLDIDSIQLQIDDSADFELAAEGDNTAINNGAIQVVAGIGALAIGADDDVCINITGLFTSSTVNYSVKVIATVEGDLTDITLALIADGAC